MTIKDFKGCKSQYAYDKDSQIYTMKVMFKGKPVIITVRIGKELTDLTVTDLEGNILEYMGQKGDKFQYTKAKNIKEFL